ESPEANDTSSMPSTIELKIKNSSLDSDCNQLELVQNEANMLCDFFFLAVLLGILRQTTIAPGTFDEGCFSKEDILVCLCSREQLNRCLSPSYRSLAEYAPTRNQPCDECRNENGPHFRHGGRPYSGH